MYPCYLLCSLGILAEYKPINTHNIGLTYGFPMGAGWDRGTSNYPLKVDGGKFYFPSFLTFQQYRGFQGKLPGSGMVKIGPFCNGSIWHPVKGPGWFIGCPAVSLVSRSESLVYFHLRNEINLHIIGGEIIH